jgi:hypothetical protein
LFVGGLDDRALSWFNEYFKQYDGVDLRAAIEYWRGTAPAASGAASDALRLYVLLPLLLIGPPTVMAGMSFPLLQRVVQTDLDRLGRRVGLLLTSNVAGSTVGAFVTGLLLLDWIGTAGTFRLLFVVSAGFAFAAIRWSAARPAARGIAFAAVALVSGTVLWAIPGGSELWGRLHGTTPQLVIEGEDGSGLSVLRGERADFRRTVVYVNGLGQSWVPYGGVHTVLGALPAFVHPHPRRAALIGLGSGDTLFAMAGRPELERITSVEIIAPQLATLRTLAAWQGYPGLQGILKDPRIEHVDGDGRRYLSRSREQFDIIQADALRPHSAYAGNLYSDAYFRLLRERLAPKGLAVSWAPTERIVRTFRAVFPHVARHDDIVLGSLSPIDLNGDAVAARVASRHVRDYYTLAGVDIEALLAPYLKGWQVFDATIEGPGEGDINTDLAPRDEFNIPPVLDLPFATD